MRSRNTRLKLCFSCTLHGKRLSSDARAAEGTRSHFCRGSSPRGRRPSRLAVAVEAVAVEGLGVRLVLRPLPLEEAQLKEGKEEK